MAAHIEDYNKINGLSLESFVKVESIIYFILTNSDKSLFATQAMRMPNREVSLLEGPLYTCLAVQ